MSQLPLLIVDLALMLAVAAMTTILFKWLRLPLVLGYIVAGIIISPNFIFFPNIYEFSDLQVWGEIGVIFLLFGLGLEFSFKKLAKIGGAASVTAGFEAIGMGLIGFFVGKFLGWPMMDCIFLGACLTVSSSTVLVKTFGDLGLKRKNFSGIVFGVLVVEDIIAVTLLVLLGTFVVKQEVDGGQILFSILKLVFFLILWFVGGILLIPSLLNRAKRFLTDEILLISSIALCFVMVFFSTQAGFSAALGAFVMGSLLAETTKAERVEHLLRPVRDLFGAIFFISVGMLIDLYSLAIYIWPVIIIALAVIIGKTLVIGTGAYISGSSLKVSLQAGMSLTLIGEFSFIIAALGAKYNATSDYLYPVIIAASAITILTAPYLTMASGPFYDWIFKKLPASLQEKINRYSAEATSLRTTSAWQQLVRSFLMNTTIFSVVLIALIVATTKYLFPWLASINYNLGGIASAAVALAIMSPFLWALAVRNERTPAFAEIYTQNRYIGPIWIMRILKIVIALFFILILLNSLFSTEITIYSALVIIVLIIIFRNPLQRFYNRIEDRFVENLNTREIAEQKELAQKMAEKRNTQLGPWDAHMTYFEVPPEANDVVGKSLQELQWRERIGVNVALIVRGQQSIVNPGREERIFPNDKLFIICTDSQERRMNVILRPNKKLVENAEQVEMKLGSFLISSSSVCVNKTIRDADLRTRVHGLVVGIERNGERILNPESDMQIEEGDILWVVGDKKLLSHTVLNQ